MKNIFQSAAPASKLLQKHIAYYYFDQSTDESHKKSFFYYPHYKNAMTIYKNSTVTLEGPYSTITKPSPVNYFFGFAKLINHAAKAQIQSPFNKIGIVFQPLGLNQFLPGNLCDFMQDPITLEFNIFKASFEPVLDKIYSTDIIAEKVTLLDEYFLSIYIGFKNDKIEKAIDILIKNDAKYSVDELADALDINRKSLLRLFRKHQNCSVIDYIKLIQFRKAIDNFQNSVDKSTLTKLAHDTSYYDQSDFINHFKKLTGFNPKSFFNNISDQGKEGTYWTFS